ncbi:MAG: hypothetical protein CMO81_08435 [Waddliaceae bacterium]|nr:hypothetical protein [Waddliaceae bacterium]
MQTNEIITYTVDYSITNGFSPQITLYNKEKCASITFKEGKNRYWEQTTSKSNYILNNKIKEIRMFLTYKNPPEKFSLENLENVCQDFSFSKDPDFSQLKSCTKAALLSYLIWSPRQSNRSNLIEFYLGYTDLGEKHITLKDPIGNIAHLTISKNDLSSRIIPILNTEEANWSELAEAATQIKLLLEPLYFKEGFDLEQIKDECSRLSNVAKGHRYSEVKNYIIRETLEVPFDYGYRDPESKKIHFLSGDIQLA